MYHRFGQEHEFRKLSATAFEQHMVYLKKHFHPVRLSELAQRLADGETLMENSVVVTVDDGYADFRTIAVPILTRYGIPATFFVVSEFINRKLWLWFDAIHYLVHAVKRERVSLTLGESLQTIYLANSASRDLLWGKIADDVYCLPMEKKWQRISELATDLALTLPEIPTPAYEPTTWKELRELNPRLFDIGGHTKSHAILSLCHSQELSVELEESKQTIENNLQREITTFCYPNGQQNDYNETCVHAVRKAGYKCAVVAHGSLVHPHSDPYRIERLSPSSIPITFRTEMNGISHLRNRFEAMRHG
jgi:peptidoglycan/xylan/chitin deacetylase (PgdA/CDA1 family)